MYIHHFCISTSVYAGLILSLKIVALFLNVSVPFFNRSCKLRRLEIAYSYIGGLAAALKKFPLLEELSLYPGTLHREDIEALGCYCPMLKTLKLNHYFGNFDGTNLVGDELRWSWLL